MAPRWLQKFKRSSVADIEGNPVPKGRRKDRSGSESLNGAGSTGGSGGTTGGGGGGLRSKSVHTSFGDVSLNTFLKREYIKWYIILVVILILVILMTVFHHQIVQWLTPFAQKLHDLTGGWAIPIGVLFVISFPPLFGHEIVAVLCGLVWGFWEGFGIVAAGTFLGEVGNFYAFKYLCTGRAQKYERENINYACMAHIVREGGFKIVFLARLSAIPGHFTTAVFATTGMNIWTFSLAAILTLPKQMSVVYLGTIFDQEASQKSTASKIVEYSVLFVSFAVTIFAAWYLYREMGKARPAVEAEQRRKAEAKALGYPSGAVMSDQDYGSSQTELVSKSEFSATQEDLTNPMVGPGGPGGGGGGGGRGRDRRVENSSTDFRTPFAGYAAGAGMGGRGGRGAREVDFVDTLGYQSNHGIDASSFSSSSSPYYPDTYPPTNHPPPPAPLRTVDPFAEAERQQRGRGGQGGGGGGEGYGYGYGYAISPPEDDVSEESHYWKKDRGGGGGGGPVFKVTPPS